MKKVILFIVEGVTDERALGGILNALFKKDKKISFQIVHTDITSEENSNINNIEEKINEQIMAKCRIEGLWKTDILQVIHLVDMDGAYVADECIMYDDNACAFYTKEAIKTKFVERLKERNKRKSTLLSKLEKIDHVFELPYKVYYFSCNLEHVLHNEQNAAPENKNTLAEEFADRFYNEPEKFIRFLYDPEFMVDGDYQSTWNYIKQDKNSLQCRCNFHLYFEELE